MKSIVKILSDLDDKIELNRKMNETLEAMARALFKSWFVDFDPVRAKAEGRSTGLPDTIAALFPDSFEDSKLRRIPQGWRVSPILSQACLLSGGTPKTDKPEYWNGDISWASAKDVSQSAQSILINTERRITRMGLEKSATQIIPAFATCIVARGATTGRMVLFGQDMAMNQTCYGLVSKTDTPIALYCLLREHIDGLVHGAHGSVFDTITTSTFQQANVVAPPTQLLVGFEKLIAPLFRKMLSNVLESQALIEVRDAILPGLISGEIRLSAGEERH